MAERELLSQRAYAARIGVSHAAVGKAIKRGRLSRCLVAKGKRQLIDPLIADEEWRANTDPTPRGGKPLAPQSEPAEPRDPEQVEDYHLARARRESAQADLAELERDEKEATLVDSDLQRRDGFQCGRIVRDAILNVPDRITAQLAATSDAHEIHAILTEELVDALRSLADEERGKLPDEGDA